MKAPPTCLYDKLYSGVSVGRISREDDPLQKSYSV